METSEIAYRVSLDCGHYIITQVELRNQYPTDIHFILCPPCEKDKDLYGRVPTAWRNVVGIEELHDPLHYVFHRDAFIMPNRIMRLQPSVKHHKRIRPFPYVKRVLR